MENIKEINVNYNFTTDTPGFWDDYWLNRKGLGMFNNGCDPDSKSKTLQNYNKILYSRELPNKEIMKLDIGKSSYHYLTWKNFRFGSDIIFNNFCYERYPVIWEIKKNDLKYKQTNEEFINKTYTIGGSIIFPKRINSINVQRGRNPLIRDRFDLTLECIRRFYKSKEKPLQAQDSPLSKTLEEDEAFFDLFVDFESYVDFFFLQDFVSANYSEVNFWCNEKEIFNGDPLPNNIEQYYYMIKVELEKLSKRNERISTFIKKASNTRFNLTLRTSRKCRLSECYAYTFLTSIIKE